MKILDVASIVLWVILVESIRSEGELSKFVSVGLNLLPASRPSLQSTSTTKSSIQSFSIVDKEVVASDVSNYKGANSSVLYDMVPIYVCNNSHSSIHLSEWYGICKFQCSYLEKTAEYRMRLYTKRKFLQSVDVYSLQIFHQSRHSHESIGGSCHIDVSEMIPYTPSFQEINLLRTDILSHIVSSNYGTFSNISDPACDYWNDYQSEGLIYQFSKHQWSAIQNGDNSVVLSDPYSLKEFLYSDGAAEVGGRWFIWNNDLPIFPASCPYEILRDHDCVYTPNTGLAICDRGELIINTNGASTITQTCAGVNLLASSNGIYYSVVSIESKVAVADRIADILSGPPGTYSGLTGLIAALSDTIGTLESTYCSSLCDLADRSFQMIVNNEDVVDTANGPWLPVYSLGNISVIPCAVNQEFKLVIPLQICRGGKLFRVIGQSNKDYKWWDPMKTYISVDDSCNHHEVNDFREAAQNNEAVIFSFWRGLAVLDPPYTGPLRWTPRIDPMAVRSSKWFPKIRKISDTLNLTLTDIEHHIISSVNLSGTVISKNTTSYKETSNQVLFILKKIWVDTCHSIYYIWNKIAGPARWIIGCAVTLLIGYIILIVISIIRPARHHESW